MGERVLCKHEVVGSIPSASTRRLAVGFPSLERGERGMIEGEGASF